jgi:hypothetical protein
LTRTAGANVPGGESQRLLKGRDIPGDWHRLFGSRQLLTLTERALHYGHHRVPDATDSISALAHDAVSLQLLLDVSLMIAT